MDEHRLCVKGTVDKALQVMKRVKIVGPDHDFWRSRPGRGRSEQAWQLMHECPDELRSGRAPPLWFGSSDIDVADDARIHRLAMRIIINKTTTDSERFEVITVG